MNNKQKVHFYSFYWTYPDEGYHPKYLDWPEIKEMRQYLPEAVQRHIDEHPNYAVQNGKRERIIVTPKTDMNIEDALLSSRTIALQYSMIQQVIEGWCADENISTSMNCYAYEEPESRSSQSIQMLLEQFLDVYRRKVDETKRNHNEKVFIIKPSYRFERWRHSPWIEEFFKTHADEPVLRPVDITQHITEAPQYGLIDVPLGISFSDGERALNEHMKDMLDHFKWHQVQKQNHTQIKKGKAKPDNSFGQVVYNSAAEYNKILQEKVWEITDGDERLSWEYIAAMLTEMKFPSKDAKIIEWNSANLRRRVDPKRGGLTKTKA
ncbi:hypothetical protein [Magnetovibrio blakemorei]|uniref:Uncharacterized protein n=1 Tax=Magnetovibrio blakemorei TaxID=28181 RepID=A0A1E5Q785_9PROT|nr:hypothetical protein [Magnetovibrio blakemorei]OEJ66812.1 hypothetical protein BEN30_11315 [Magnetovibrio blakemorei]